MAAYSLELNRNETEIFGLDQYREYQYQEPVFYNNPFLINDPVVQLLGIVSLPITPSYRFHLCCNQVISFHVFEEDNNGTVCSVDMVCTGFYLSLYISDLLQVAHVSNMQMYSDDTVTYTHAKTATLLASKLTIAMLM